MSEDSQLREGASEARFALVVTVAFAVVALAKLFTHEPWRDEWGVWGMALELPTFGDFWRDLSYGGHPRLWHVAVFALQRAFGRFEAVQALAALLATVAVWVMARYGPFPRWSRVLFALGYFPLFEYSSIARPYSIALATACAAAALFRRGLLRPLPLAIVLALLANTTVYGLILSVAFCAAYGVDYLRSESAGRARAPSVALAAALVAASWALAILQMVPPPNSTFAPRWQMQWEGGRAMQTLNVLVRGVAPLPSPGLHFWNTHVLGGHDTAAALVSAAILVGVALLLRRSLPALTLWLVGCFGHFSFAYVKYAGYSRHHGHLFLALLAAFWIALGRQRAEGRSSRMTTTLVGTLLGLHAVVGVYAVAMDFQYPFSSARAAAAAIQARGLEELPMAGARASTAASVACALGRPILLSGTGRTSTFVLWDESATESSHGGAIADSARLAKESGASLLVLDKPLPWWPPRTRIVTFTPESIVRDEQFFVYRVER